MLSAHESQISTFTCNTCGKLFTNEEALRGHITRVHENSSRITRKAVLEMVENDQHPFYTKDDLPMIQKGLN